MQLSTILFALFRFFLPPALIVTILLYTYPAAQNCSFPARPRSTQHGAGANEPSCFLDGKPSAPQTTTPLASRIAPFRLLALGDPQLEGSTSLPDPSAPWFPAFRNLRARIALSGDKPATVLKVAKEVVQKDIPRIAQAARKRVDLLGNDFYLAHVFWLVRWWTAPTHVVVLGDLLGSQWISDGEFDVRAERYWKRVFKGTERVADDVTGFGRQGWGDSVQVLGEEDWRNKLINVAGNHDIGYAGDINEHRIERFETAFGAANWVIKFQLPFDAARDEEKGFLGTSRTEPPALEVVVLNSMNLDEPAWQDELRVETLKFLDAVARRDMRSQDARVLLTHIPLAKDEGVCVDGPFFAYFPEEQGGGIREQNHLSQDSSWKILYGLFSGHRTGVILNGHDHEGCDVLHQRHSGGDGSWISSRYHPAANLKSDGGDKIQDIWHSYGGEKIREITVRSMMGSYGGNAGLLSAWFDEEAKEWKFEYDVCALGVQHIWWAVHVFDLVVILFGLLGVEALRREWAAERREWDRQLEEETKNKKKV